MAGVRKIADFPLRYVVTFSHKKHLDDCELRVVEQVMPHPNRPYWLCLKHQQMDCQCVHEVTAYRQSIGLGEQDRQGD